MLKQYPAQSDAGLVKRKARAMSTTSHAWVNSIKAFHKPLTPEEGTLFRQEEALLTHLSHPHLVRVLACGVEGSTCAGYLEYPFLNME
jgi:hypothetical protein